MNRIISIVALLITIFSLHAQTLKQAENFYNNGQYNSAKVIYLKLLKNNPKDNSLKCKVGHCLVDLSMYEEALPYLKSAANNGFNQAYLYLYDAYFNLYDFENALEALNTYIENEIGAEDQKADIQTKLIKAELGASMLSRVEDIAIIDSIKLVKKDLLSAYRLSSELGYLDLYFEVSGVPTAKQQVAYCTGREDKLITTKEMDNAQLDLGVSYNLVGGWTPETELSSVINTQYDENYPFELPDGITLYFASKGHNSLGGYDIFMSRYNSETNEYSEPINIGMPFNSPANDYMLVYDEMANVGWFATDRFQIGDTVVVYEFIPNQEKILLKIDDPKYVKEVAQLRSYRKGSLASIQSSILVDSLEKEKTEINFMVNDGIVYTTLDQFVSPEAKALYLKLQSTDKRLSTLQKLLEGKRREYFLSKDEQDNSILISEILELESQISRYNDLVQEFILQTRREEIKAISQ